LVNQDEEGVRILKYVHLKSRKEAKEPTNGDTINEQSEKENRPTRLEQNVQWR
jgi:hypothetical protein